MTETSLPFKPCIIVHGGAGSVPMSKRKPALCAVKEAARIGYHVLLEVRILIPGDILAISVAINIVRIVTASFYVSIHSIKRLQS